MNTTIAETDTETTIATINPADRRVRKVKRNAKGFVTVAYEVPNGSDVDTYSMTCKSEPHADLLQAFQDLLPSVEEICEFDHDYTEKMVVSGVSFTFKETESGPIRGAVVTAQKLLKNHPAPMIINTPHKTDVPYGEDGDDSACFSTATAMTLETVEQEALKFVDGKRGEKPAEDDALMETPEDQ